MLREVHLISALFQFLPLVMAAQLALGAYAGPVAPKRSWLDRASGLDYPFQIEPSWNAGVLLDWFFHEQIAMRGELGYQEWKHLVNFGFDDYWGFREHMQVINFGASLRITPVHRFKMYLLYGTQADILAAGTATVYSDVVTPPGPIRFDRKYYRRVHLLGHIGAGLPVTLRAHRLFVEWRYQYAINNFSSSARFEGSLRSHALVFGYQYLLGH